MHTRKTWGRRLIFRAGLLKTPGAALEVVGQSMARKAAMVSMRVMVEISGEATLSLGVIVVWHDLKSTD